MLTAEKVGRALGWLLAPVTASLSALRHSRMFHPDGVVYRGLVEPAPDTPWPEAAARLAGPALLRLSTAWWKHGRELPDALGLAIRFRRSEAPNPTPHGDDQDLLLATIRHPWTTPFAPLSTQVHDFLDNDYYGVSPFFVDGVGRVYLRAVSSRPRTTGRDRRERFERAVDGGVAFWRLEARLVGERAWRPLARITAGRRVAIDQAALRFWPFRAGRGLEPRGLVNGLRWAAYRASWLARPHRSTVDSPSLARLL